MSFQHSCCNSSQHKIRVCRSSSCNKLQLPTCLVLAWLLWSLELGGESKSIHASLILPSDSSYKQHWVVDHKSQEQHLHARDWSKLKLKQANSKNPKKIKKAPTKDAPKRDGLHDCLEIWHVQKHAILNSNINILSRELQMEQKKWVDKNQEKKNEELSVSPFFDFLIFVFLLLSISHFTYKTFFKNRHWFRFRVWRTLRWRLMPHCCCVLSLQRRTFSCWGRTLPSSTVTTPNSMSQTVHP